MNLLDRLRARRRHLSAVVRPSGYSHAGMLVSHSKFFEDYPLPGDEASLARDLRRHGSDKSTRHDYHRIYATILQHVPRGPMLEIGLGSNDPSVPSNMGIKGIPGASVRAWRDTQKFTEVWGADVDRGALFSEPGIQTRYVDQLIPSTLTELGEEISRNSPEGLALIVDDGLHTSEANINTVSSLWPYVREGGFLCVEDMEPPDLQMVMDYCIRGIADADWALWTNADRASDNNVFILRRHVTQ